MLWMATGVRCTSVEEEDIIFYKQHGCSALKFGIESGSQVILDLMEKFFTLEDVVKRVKLCHKHRVYSPLAVMVGMPGETENTALETGRLIGNIAADLGIEPKKMGYDIFYALPLPGTPLYEYGEKLGVIDPSPQGTGEYLERVTDAGTYKRYYVNLNGAPDSEVVFWDVLIAMEASRTYRRLLADRAKSLSPLPNQISEGTIISSAIDKKKKSNPRYSLKYTALTFTSITYFIDTIVIGSACVDALPRYLIYPLVKMLNYIEFVLQSLDRRNTNNNIFAMRKVQVPRLDTQNKASKKNPKHRSLRAYVEEMDYQHSNFIKGLSLEHLKARSALVKGL